MEIPEVDIDLDAPAEQRWEGLAPFGAQARDLMGLYLADLGDPRQVIELLREPIEACVEPELLEELRALSEILGCAEEEVLLSNLYYDAIKHAFGCSAFAVDTPRGPLHARNLDWPSEGDALARSTMKFRFLRGGKLHFLTVGWPGFIGCLSGMAPGRFSVTLNSVWSEDSAEFRVPVPLLVRIALDRAQNFEEAVQCFRDTEIASDCLLLVTGTKAGEMAVVERTPLRAAVRWPEESCVVVTNDYRALESSAHPVTSELTETSCSRFERALEICTVGNCLTSEAALVALADPKVRMEITAQQMVFLPATGAAVVRVPLE